MVITVSPGGSCLLLAKPQGQGVPWLRSELLSATVTHESPGLTTTCKELTAVCGVSVDLLQKAIQRRTRDEKDHK